MLSASLQTDIYLTLYLHFELFTLKYFRLIKKYKPAPKTTYQPSSTDPKDMVPLPSTFCVQHPTFRTAVLLPWSPLHWAAPGPCPLCPWNLQGGLASDTVACPIFLMIEFKLYSSGRIISFHQKFGATILFFLTGHLIWVLERMVLFWGVLGNQRIAGTFVGRN